MKLDLSKHCIETEIRRLYNRDVSRYIRLKRGDRQIEADIELLKLALESLDFSQLRSGYPALAGRAAGCTVELVASGADGIVIMLDGIKIE